MPPLIAQFKIVDSKEQGTPVRLVWYVKLYELRRTHVSKGHDRAQPFSLTEALRWNAVQSKVNNSTVGCELAANKDASRIMCEYVRRA